MATNTLEFFIQNLLDNDLDFNQISYLAKMFNEGYIDSFEQFIDYSSSQLEQIYLAFLDDINIEPLCKINLSPYHMETIRWSLKKDCFVEELISEDIDRFSLNSYKRYLKTKDIAQHTTNFKDEKIIEQLNFNRLMLEDSKTSLEESDYKTDDLDSLFIEDLDENIAINDFFTFDINIPTIETINPIYTIDDEYISFFLDYDSLPSITEQLDDIIFGLDLLTTEDETILFNKYKNGDLNAYNRIIFTNLRLVLHMSKVYRAKTLEECDIFQAGYDGLLKAIDRFDVTLGYKFSTYATLWIKQTIHRYISDFDNPIRIPVHYSERLNKFSKCISELDFIANKDYTLNDIAAEMNKALQQDQSKYTIENIYDLIKNYSLIKEDGFIQFNEEDPLINQYTFQNYDDPYSNLINSCDTTEKMKQIFELLNEREKYVIQERYGFNALNKSKTLEEIGQEMGVTRERIRQIEAKAIRKLTNTVKRTFYNKFS